MYQMKLKYDLNYHYPFYVVKWDYHNACKVEGRSNRCFSLLYITFTYNTPSYIFLQKMYRAGGGHTFFYKKKANVIHPYMDVTGGVSHCGKAQS